MYLNYYALDMTYITPPGNKETLRTFKRREYGTLHIMSRAAKEAPEMRITRLIPETNWRQVWKNLHTACVPEETKSNWYVVLHDIIPTNERLHAIRLAESDRCTRCERRDTLTHRFTEGKEGTAVWQWTKERIAWIFRMNPRYIPADWSLRTQFRL